VQVTVHIDELHSEVMPAAAPNQGAGARRSEPPWDVQERWREVRCREDAMAARVCAVDFDD
jgi:hypothetical protein